MRICIYTCMFVSSGAPVGQHVSAPAESLSKAVISTYHSNWPVREDTGTHNPHSRLPLLHIQHSSAAPLFSFGLELVGNCRANKWQISPASFSNCNKRGSEAYRVAVRPGKSQYSNCRVC